MSVQGLAVMRKSCDQCLFTKRRVVPLARKEQIVRETLACDTHFECHKGTIAREHIVCAGWAKRYDSQGLQIARRLSLVVLVDGPEGGAK